MQTLMQIVLIANESLQPLINSIQTEVVLTSGLSKCNPKEVVFMFKGNYGFSDEQMKQAYCLAGKPAPECQPTGCEDKELGCDK